MNLRKTVPSTSEHSNNNPPTTRRLPKKASDKRSGEYITWTWYREEQKEGDSDIFVYAKNPDGINKKVVARVYGDGSTYPRNIHTAPRADLVAAAPDLLKALKTLVENVVDSDACDAETGEVRKDIQIAQLAIDKAMGRH